MARAPRTPGSLGPAGRALTVVAVLVVLGLVVTAGTLLRPQQPDARQVVTVAPGQANAVCTVGTVPTGGDGSSGSAGASPSPGAAPTGAAPSPSETAVPTPAPGAPATSASPDPGGSVTPPVTVPSSTPSSSPAATPGPAVAALADAVLGAAPAARPAAPSPTATPDEVPTPGPDLTPTPTLPSTDPGATPGPVPGTTPSATPGTVPSTAPTIAPLPSATAEAVNGSVTVVASGPTDLSGDDPTGRVTLGALVATGATDPTGVTVDRQGRGASLDRAAAPVLLQADGTLAPTAVGAVLSRAADGAEAGLEAAPCVVPSTSAWLPGVASGASDRTELVLSNADDAEATVDLTFYGRNGRVAVPGSPAVGVPARSSRSVSLSGLVDAEGPLTVAVQATEGRVAAVARRIRTSGDTPAGADWVVPASAPARSVVVPAVPGDDGARELVVTNPGELRASVDVSVLGLQGPFAPAGAETIDLPPQSSGTVALADGLAGTGSGVALTSDQPVTAAVVSTSAREDAQADVAVQPATPALVRTGVSALATTRNTDAELVVSNAATADVSVHFSVRSLDGVELRSGDILLAAGGSATRRLASPAPSYVVVDVPDGSSVTGGVDLVEPDGDVAGLASVPLVSPDTSGPPPVVEQDPGAGR